MCPQKDVHLDGMNRAVAQRLSRCSSCRFSSAMPSEDGHEAWLRKMATEQSFLMSTLGMELILNVVQCFPMFPTQDPITLFSSWLQAPFRAKCLQNHFVIWFLPAPWSGGDLATTALGEVAHLGECHYNYLISDNGPRRSHCMTCDDVWFLTLAISEAHAIWPLIE